MVWLPDEAGPPNRGKMETTELVKPTVWGVERCDSCLQRAAYLAYKSELLLTFCNHHMNKHMDSLSREGWEIDELD